ncbi:GNAT family N-acetyltransferase [Candidatus Woesearchaeota archaeon]|nr:GNAT family N-acetyltransferase [Candidatus Woesearchaeota archaeon]
MKCRKATLKDAKNVAKVLLSFYNIKDPKESKKVFLDELKKGHTYLIAEEKKEIIGLTTWLPHGLPKHGLAELDRIVVLEQAKGKGVAKQLFNTLKKDAKAHYKKHKSKLRKLYLLTHANNKRAHSFYKKMGFKHETTLKKHYYNKVDEFVFSIFF